MKYLEMSSLFTEKLLDTLSAKDLPMYLNYLYQEYHYPCNVVDAAHRLLASAPENHMTGDIYWDSSARLKRIPQKLLDFTHDYKYTEQTIINTKKGQITNVNWGNVKYPNLVSAIIINGKVSGYSNLLFTGPDDALEDALAVAAILRDGVHIIMQDSVSAFEYRYTDIWTDLCNKIFQHRFCDTNEAISWAKSCGLTMKSSYAIMCVNATDSADADGGYFNALMLSIYDNVLYQSIDRDFYYLLFGIEHTAHLQRITQEFSSHIMFDYALGVSRLFNDLEHIDTHIEQARLAFQHCKAFSLPEHICTFGEEQIHILRNLPLHRLGKSACTHPAFTILQQHDSVNQTKYFLTLMTYLQEFGDRQRTEKVLSIHRNTLSYRLSRIEDLCALNLSDPAVLNKLFLSYYVSTSI